MHLRGQVGEEPGHRGKTPQEQKAQLRQPQTRYMFCFHLMLKESRSLAQRHAEFRRQAGDCKMRGRRLLAMVCGHVDDMLLRLQSTRCAKYEEYLSTCDQHFAGKLNDFSSRLGLKLLARLKLKFQYLKESPVILIGGIGYLHGMCSQAESKALVREGLKQRDDAINRGCIASLHRVARKLTMGDSVYAKCLDEFAASDTSDIDLATRVCLRDYSLGKVVTRQTEAAHAHIKSHIGKKVGLEVYWRDDLGVLCVGHLWNQTNVFRSG